MLSLHKTNKHKFVDSFASAQNYPLTKMDSVCLGKKERFLLTFRGFHTLVLKSGQLTFVLTYIQISMCVSKYINHTLKDCAPALPSV